jgi:2,3-bisphosphoglycerate-independent phosphoglycerate mutase
MSGKGPLVLAIADGFGLREGTTGNAVAAANTPNIDRMLGSCPCSRLSASGEDVGLPRGQMGNSEVGHANIGAGRIVYQDLSRLNRAVESGEFARNPALTAACNRAAASGALHILGLVSDGGVHSHSDHIKAMAKLAQSNGVSRLYLHLFTDGRDVSPTSGLGFIEDMADFLSRLGLGRIATLCGRYYAMDRDKRWPRVEAAYRCMTQPVAQVVDPAEAIAASYATGVTDEFIEPVACCEGGRIADGDTVVFMNFRPDRARQLTRALMDPDFTGFERERLQNLQMVTLTEYEPELPGVTVAFGPEVIRQTLGDVLEAAGLSQLRVAETEKYAHVTFFFDGGSETTRPHEKRLLIPSAKVATYDLAPEMQAEAITDAVLAALPDYDFILLNYANCDMVGHTGVFSAAVAAVETVDAQLGRLWAGVQAAGGRLIFTADHGNAEEMIDSGGGPMTAHTTNRVPFCLMGEEGAELASQGILADIAPTVLDLLGLPVPSEMTGRSLIINPSIGQDKTVE